MRCVYGASVPAAEALVSYSAVSLRLCLRLQFLTRSACLALQRSGGTLPSGPALPEEEGGGRQALRPPCPDPRGAPRSLRPLPGGERREKPLPERWGLLWGLGMWILASEKGSGGISGAGDLGAG